MSADKYQQLLDERQAGSLIYYKPKLIEINSKTTLEETLKLLSERNILAVPVFDQEKQEYIGIVHTFDILLYIVYGFFKDDEEVTADALKAKIEKCRSTPASDLIGIAHYGHSGWWHSGILVYEPTKKVREILEILSRGVQRVLVRCSPTIAGREGDIEVSHPTPSDDLRVLSQSDFIKFLIIHAQATLDFTEHNTLEQLHLTHFDKEAQPATVPETASALSAFRILYTRPVDAVGVVDANGALVANLSASDLRGLTIAELPSLLKPVGEYLKSRYHGHYLPPVTTTPQATLKSVMTLVASTGVHRVWVIDPQTKAQLGVVRLTDILKVFEKGHPLA